MSIIWNLNNDCWRRRKSDEEGIVDHHHHHQIINNNNKRRWRRRGCASFFTTMMMKTWNESSNQIPFVPAAGRLKVVSISTITFQNYKTQFQKMALYAKEQSSESCIRRNKK
jgi:hypothetical protein